MSSSSAEILTPEDQLGGLLELLRQGIQTKAHTKVFQLRQRIKTHCSKHGLPTPSEAFAHGRAPRGAIVSQAPPAPTVAVLPMATNREAQPLNVKPKTKTGPERESELKALTAVRDRARTLRGEAWKLIETVQGLPQEDLQALVEDLRYIALGATTALNVVKIRLGRP
jgi:hypothetical protein